MRKTGIILGSATMALSLLVSHPALSQDIDFGDDASRWANDGQCDDPRFEGSGAAAVRTAADEGHDATDCRTAFEAGTITLAGDADAATAPPSASDDIDFGDDSGAWANDGECDDPRFGGTLDTHRLADANDCRTAYEAGEVTYDGSVVISGAVQPSSEIDFGDNSGHYANDGECDDPRFGGLLESHILADAADCLAAYEGGHVEYIGLATSSGASIDFGEDSGSFANDGECDDPRFGGLLTSQEYADASDCRAAYEADPSIYVGETERADDAAYSGDIDFGDDVGEYSNDGMCDDARFLPAAAFDYSRMFVGMDATDCRLELATGDATYVATTDIGSIDFGDDSGAHANDGECEDPRFVGPGTFGEANESWIRVDATDCRAAMQTGAYYIGMAFADPGTDGSESSSGEHSGAAPIDTSAFIDSIDFGDNTSDYAHNNICDDPRFTGPGMTSILLFADRMADASDCEALFAQGQISFNGVSGDPALAGIAEIDFGDDTSSYANNNKCDDPRFAGPGTDSVLVHGDPGHDATDCLALFESGEVYLAGLTRVGDTGSAGQPTSNFRINFGDDTGSHPNDGECDDPRFQGRGAAMELFEDNILGDATDCRAAYDAGTVTYMP